MSAVVLRPSGRVTVISPSLTSCSRRVVVRRACGAKASCRRRELIAAGRRPDALLSRPRAPSRRPWSWSLSPPRAEAPDALCDDAPVAVVAAARRVVVRTKRPGIVAVTRALGSAGSKQTAGSRATRAADRLARSLQHPRPRVLQQCTHQLLILRALLPQLVGHSPRAVQSLF